MTQVTSWLLPSKSMLPRGVTFEESADRRRIFQSMSDNGNPSTTYVARLVTEDGRSADITLIPGCINNANQRDIIEYVRLKVLAALKELGYDNIKSPHTANVVPL